MVVTVVMISCQVTMVPNRKNDGAQSTTVTCQMRNGREFRGDRGAGAAASVVVPPTTDCMSGGAEREQNDPDHHENDADRPQDRDASQESDDQQDNSENDHGPSFDTDHPLRATYPLVTALKHSGRAGHGYGRA